MTRIRKDLRPVEINGQLSLKELLKRCREELCDDSEIVRKVKLYVKTGWIKSTQPNGRNTLLYLPEKSQEMIKNIFRHIRDFRLADISTRLVDVATAAARINIEQVILNYLLNQYGAEYGLTSQKNIPHCLTVESGGRYGQKPRIPFIKWFPFITDAPRYLTTPVVAGLGRHLPKVEKKIRSSWARNLTTLIKEDERRRQKFLYFQDQ